LLADGLTSAHRCRRVAVPITLHAKAGPSTKGWWNGKPSLLPPAEDAIEQQERDNLWWYMCVMEVEFLHLPVWLTIVGLRQAHARRQRINV
jgi:hypothetical protein